MILPAVRYLRPASLDDAVHYLSKLDDAVVLAGGQTLVNSLKLDQVAPSYLVDVHRLEELGGIEVAADGTVTIGAATTYAAIAASPEVRTAAPAVASMAAGLVDRQVRNRGTIGGNVCLNDPTNNFPPLLVALGARFHTAGPSGRRDIHADDFFAGTLTTALQPAEVLVGVEISPLPEGRRSSTGTCRSGPTQRSRAAAVRRLLGTRPRRRRPGCLRLRPGPHAPGQ